MVPIHDTDVAEERWSKAEWENYELWERVELRLKRQRRIWIFSTGILFMILSAVPIVVDRWPKWVARSLSRHLAQEINEVKKDASINRAAYRLRFIDERRLNFVIEKLNNCAAAQGQVVRSGSLTRKPDQVDFTWVPPVWGNTSDIPGLVSEFCYDYLSGNGYEQKGESIVGFGIIPAKDLAEKRLDRLSVLLLSGPSAEISFD